MSIDTPTPPEVLEALQSEISTDKEAQEVKSEESKIYSAEDLDALMQKYKERSEKNFPDKKGFSAEERLNFDDGKLLSALSKGEKMSKEDSRSLLASLDESGIQKIRDLASQNEERNQGRKDTLRMAEKLGALAKKAEKLAGLRSEAGQQEFIQDAIQDLEASRTINRRLTNKIAWTLDLLNQYDKKTKDSIFQAVKPALETAGQKSTMPGDQEFTQGLITKYQS